MARLVISFFNVICKPVTYLQDLNWDKKQEFELGSEKKYQRSSIQIDSDNVA